MTPCGVCWTKWRCEALRDIWGFLIQTLTASVAAAILLLVKEMFRDKLPPRWQFSIWGLLLVFLLIPAGRTGYYALINIPLWVETCKTLLTGSYTLTQVFASIPLPPLSAPQTAADWIYLAYFAGVAALLARYLLSYFRLRRALKRGRTPQESVMAQLRSVAKQYHLPECPAVEVEGLSSAFLCGVFRPVLALPAGKVPEDKVLLHELQHLKHKDVLWGLVICLFRCIHWCNPLLWYCADRAGNDIEAACDQRVLEALEGEERRDYGRILLAMSNDRYARAPGTSSMANGGKNIRRRIEAIARFKKYPAGMGLVSVCMAILLFAHLIGVPAESIYLPQHQLPEEIEFAAAMASARTVQCTTYAGAMDTYAKAVMAESGIYRALCSPLDQHEALFDSATATTSHEKDIPWSSGLTYPVNMESGYYIYNLEALENGAYQG
ncbi:MAG: M56 family metallopeptidase, partial [Ruminococcaceae bacterium]|nr:M56 family metallopeptidase [Oscillospiraceae bacterium]